ncbi:helix-turn-helix domain-containing protein [Desulfosporosinus nitroreducens]|uniref:helix-turn-helix domain-containing protein n=1 Tax=Desulfosporosinus nitroreducens TaxID=2018668 RepID=UPI00207CF3D1|nr:helix-turn-helix transcriptional regulator [Desulfosporosinus nitroreducens]MCO1599786.1 helix-turn-helix transcriptional regulator [Desulfosporosinus nitroreducens]
MAKRRKYPVLNSLKGRITEQGTSYRKLADGIGIAVNTLSDKINGFYAMSIPEAEAIAEFLEISPREMDKYFFPSMLRNSA